MFEELAKADMGSSGWLNKFNNAGGRIYPPHRRGRGREISRRPARTPWANAKAVELRKEFEARKPEEIERAEEGVDEG